MSRRSLRRRVRIMHGDPPIPRKKKKCKICKKIMLVAEGQIAFYHKKCRKLRHDKNIG